MFDFIDKILSSFESCFSRKAAFRWFVVLTLGLMLRSDKLGVTSVIRDLALKPDCYLSMLHFSVPPPGPWTGYGSAGFKQFSGSFLCIRKVLFMSLSETA